MQSHGLLLPVLTWLPGPLIALAFTTSSEQPARRWFYCGVATPIFWMGLGLVVVILDKYGLLSVRDLTAFLLGLVVSLLTLSLCNAVYGKTLKTKAQAVIIEAAGAASWFTPLAAILLACLLSISLLSMMLAPLSAWDSIDFWARYASEFANHAVSGHRLTFSYDERHPLTLSAAMGVAAVPSKSGDLINLWALPWAGVLFSLCATLFGLCRLIALSNGSALTVILFVVSMPLLENHIHLPFYSEFVVSSLLLNSVASLALFLKYKENPFLWLAISSLLLLSVVRNTSLFYCLVACVPLLVVGLIQQFVPSVKKSVSKHFAGIIATFVVIVLVVVAFPEVEQKGGSIVMRYASKELTLIVPSAGAFFSVIFEAYVYNISFSVAPLMALTFCITLAWRFVSGVRSSDEVMYWYVLLCIVAGVSGMALSLMTDYGLRFASPGSDTGFSRFSMPIWVLTGLALAGMFAIVNELARTDETR